MRPRALVLAALVGGFPAAAWGTPSETEEPRPGSRAGCALEGAVLDEATDAPIEGVVLSLRTLGSDAAPQESEPGLTTQLASAVTDPAGRFCLQEAAPGRHVLSLIRLGYAAPAPILIQIDEARPGPGGRDPLVVHLARAPFLERIEVRARERPGRRANRSTGGLPDSAAARVFTRGEILNAPGSFDDPGRALTSVPGVSAINDYKGILRLGGAEPEDTVFLVDGVPIENPYHFHWSRGAAAGLSGAALDRVAVRTWGLGAEVGDTIGGVIELVPSERGAQDGFLEGSLGTLMASVASGGSAGGRAGSGETVPGDGSWVVAGRYSNLALYRSLYGVEDIELPDFGDLMLRVRRPFGPALELVAGALALANSLQTSDPDEGSWDDIRSRAGGAYAGLNLARGPRFALAGRLSWSGARQRYDTSAGDHLDASDRRLRLSLSAEGGTSAGIEAGGYGAGWSAGVEGALHEGTIAGALETSGWLQPVDSRSSRASAHAALRLGSRAGWRSEIGARIDRDSRFGAAPLQPRLRIEYQALSGRGSRFTAGRYAQFPRFEQEFLASGEPLSTGISDEVGAGATFPLPAGYILDASAYARWLKDLTSEIVNKYPDLRERMGRFERGRSRAFELSLRRDAGILRPRLAVTLIDARQTRDGAASARNGDQPYLVSLGAEWLVTPRFRLLGRLQAGAGLPYSAMEPGGADTVGGLVEGPLNGQRLPAFTRLDLRGVWERPARAARLRTYLEIANALGRDNVRGRDCRWDPAAERYYFRDESSMPLVPGFGIEIAWGGAPPNR
jgi:hypothetical protein